MHPPQSWKEVELFIAKSPKVFFVPLHNLFWSTKAPFVFSHQMAIEVKDM
jgi:hypothetical protein